MPALASSSRMGAARFLVFDSLGALLHGAVFIFLGVLFSEQLDEIVQLAGRHGPVVLGVLVVLAGVLIVYKYFSRTKTEARAPRG